jgi:hypothetical protein
MPRSLWSQLHYNRSGRIKASLLRKGDLLSGILSVWRDLDCSEDGRVTLASRLNKTCPEGQTLCELKAISAGTVRRVRVVGEETNRVLCVLDECKTNGGSHPAHAHISLCRNDGHAFELDDPIFVSIHEQLLTLFTAPGTTIWTCA